MVVDIKCFCGALIGGKAPYTPREDNTKVDAK